MHELSLAEGILAVVLDVAEDQRVQRVRLRVGELQAVVPDSLQFSFALLSAETEAAGASLEIKPVRALARCGRCGTRRSLADSAVACRRCGATDPRIISGDELIVDAIELERGWRYRPRPAAAAVSRNHLLDHLFFGAPAGDLKPRFID